MDTLKRVGSLRLSKRSRKQKDGGRRTGDTNSEKSPEEGGGGAFLPEPKFYATLGRKEKNAKAYFTISFKDAVVNTLSGFQPTHIKVIFERHRKTRSSNPVLWEPSLKCTSTGSGVWHPPFIIHVAITVPKTTKGGLAGEAFGLRHKDAFVSIENVDLKGKRKLLAKARLNLSEYFESAAENDVSFRLKLHPESSKIASSSVDLTLKKTATDPTKQCKDAVPCLYDDETGSLGDERILNASYFSVESASPRESVKSKEDLSLPAAISEVTTKIEALIPVAPIATMEDTTVTSEKDLEVKPVLTAEKIEIKPVPATPPPLPPRQKFISAESPPSPGHGPMQNLVTSTPLVILTPSPPSSPPPEIIPFPTEKEQIEPMASIPSPRRSVSPHPKQALSQPASQQPRSHSPTAKTIDWSNEAPEDEEGPEDTTMGINLSACASPKVTRPTSERSQASSDKDLIEWAKARLANRRPQVKVTNLTSSWRNGLGFCLILQQAAHHSLIPAELAAEHAKDNNELAFDVADLLGMETETVREMALKDGRTDKVTVAEFLRQLRLLPPEQADLDPQTVIDFQKKWYRRAKHFRKEVGALCMAEDEEQIRLERENEKAEQKAREESRETEITLHEDQLQNDDGIIKKEMENEPVDNDVKADTNDAKTDEKAALTTTERVRRLITLAHESSSYEEEEEAGSLSSPSSAAEPNRPLGESGTILEELSQLAREESQISDELEKVEQAIREQDTEADKSDVEAMLQKYFSLVNEKNSVVRRQMQLNIAEKERAIEHKKERLQRQLQKFSDLDESRKTEAMRQEEEALLQQYVEAVNEKNELVHDLDSQEKMIAEDERIRSFIANRESLTMKANNPNQKHNIMDEVFDFFKTNKNNGGFSAASFSKK